MRQLLLSALLLTVLPADPSRQVRAAAPPPYPAAKDVPVALLVDLGAAQTLFARNETQPFLPASMTKAMTALVAFELIEAGKLREDQIVIPRPETLARWRGKGTTMPLALGDRPTVHQLLEAIATVSANDAAVVLAEGAAGSVEQWCALMNASANRLGMTGSHFATPNGWPDEGKTFVSARDLAILAEALAIHHSALYRRYIGKAEMTWNGVTQKNHDPTLRIIEGADGIKTGHTFEAGYTFLGSAERNGRRLAVVIGGARIPEYRANAARELLEWGFAAWDSRPLLGTGQIVGAAQVQGGEARHVALVATRAYALALPQAGHSVVTTRIVYDGPLQAPIARGNKIAELEIEIEHQPAHRIPLVAAATVGEAGPLDRLVNGLAGLFS